MYQVYDTSVACLVKTQGARDSLYSTGLLCSPHSGVDASAWHAALRGIPLRSVISDQNTRSPSVFLLPSQVDLAIDRIVPQTILIT